jgi:hypothetical protein
METQAKLFKVSGGKRFSITSDRLAQVINWLVWGGMHTTEAHWAATNYLLDYDWPMATDHQINLASMPAHDLAGFVRNCARDN